MMEDRGDWIAVLLCGFFSPALILGGAMAVVSGRVQFRRYETGRYFAGRPLFGKWLVGIGRWNSNGWRRAHPER